MKVVYRSNEEYKNGNPVSDKVSFGHKTSGKHLVFQFA